MALSLAAWPSDALLCLQTWPHVIVQFSWWRLAKTQETTLFFLWNFSNYEGLLTYPVCISSQVELIYLQDHCEHANLILGHLGTMSTNVVQLRSSCTLFAIRHWQRFLSFHIYEISATWKGKSVLFPSLSVLPKNLKTTKLILTHSSKLAYWNWRKVCVIICLKIQKAPEWEKAILFL